MGKGILLELEGRKAVVLTPQGEFKRIPLPKGTWDVGDEVSYAETVPMPWIRWGTWAAAAVMLMFVGVKGIDAYSLAQPVALVTVDINPSLQLTLNKRSDVLKAEALNEDGSKVLEGVDWKRHPVGEVVAAVTAKAVDLGKLNPADASGAIVVAVAPAKATELAADKSDEILTETKVAVNSAIEAKARDKGVETKTKVAAVAATKAERDEAAGKKITVGKLLIAKEIELEKPEIQPETIMEGLKEKGPGKFIQDLGINPGEIFGKAEEHHGGKPEKAKEKEKDENKGSKAEDGPAVPASGKGEDKPADDKGNDKKPADVKGNDKKPAEIKKNSDEPKPGQPGNQGNNGNNGNNGNGNGKAKDDGKGKADDKKNGKKSSESNNGLLNRIKSWFGIENEAKKPRAETPGEGASEEEAQPAAAQQPAPPARSESAQPKVEAKIPDGPPVAAPAEEKKPEVKAEEKKPASASDEKKPGGKATDPAPEPRDEEKKQPSKSDEPREDKPEKAGSEVKNPTADREKENGKGTGKSQEKP